MFAAMLTLSLTGLLLYCAGNEQRRAASSLARWILDLAAVLVFHSLIAPRHLRHG